MDTVPIHHRGPYKTAAGWSDLLGFGAELAKTGWNLSDPSSLPTIDHMLQRLARFSWTMHTYHSPEEECLMLNDGIIRTFHYGYYGDSADQGSQETLPHWVDKVLATHCLVVGWEKKNDLPGIRTVICAGEMLSYHDHPFPSHDPYERPDLSPSDENSRFLRPISTQLNTAFSKCYIAEELGSDAGLKRGGVYIEEALLSNLVSHHGCTLVCGQFLFFFHPPALAEPAKYSSVKDLYMISSSQWDRRPFLLDNTAWCELGDSKIIRSKGLEFTLREIVAFSPRDEFCLFWFNPFDGSEHGYLVDAPIRLDTGGAKCTWLEPKTPGHGLLTALEAAHSAEDQREVVHAKETNLDQSERCRSDRTSWSRFLQLLASFWRRF